MDSTQNAPVSPLFLEAFEELVLKNGLEFCLFDEAPFLKCLKTSFLHKVAFRVFNRRPLTYWKLNKSLLERVKTFRPDIVIAVKGAFIAPATLKNMKQQFKPLLVNYAVDDPFNSAANTASLKNGIPFYDLYACQKRAIIEDAQKAGAKATCFLPIGYKPSVHFPEQAATPEEAERFNSDVVFIGGCDKDRSSYFEALVKAVPHINLHLYGNYWDRNPILQKYSKGKVWGREFRLALCGTKIAVNLVRRANRDGHCMRTFEVPACGAFMLNERTEEHLEIFKEDLHVAYFNSIQEFVEKIRYYVDHERERTWIAQQGLQLIRGGKIYLY